MKIIKFIKMYIFQITVLLLLVLPALFTNCNADAISQIDNRKLRSFPEFSPLFFYGINAYLEDRIGFRDEIITAYQLGCDKLLHYMAHPLYEYGREDWIMIKDCDPVQTYHLEVDEKYVNEFTRFTLEAQLLCAQNGASYIFVIIPNKETVYSEYISNGYCIDNDNKSRSECLVDSMNAAGVNNYYLLNTFLELKKDEQLYNEKYDAGHWNMRGAFYGNVAMLNYIENHVTPNIEVISMSDFAIDSKVEKYLPNSFFRIDESVPVFSLKNPQYEEIDIWDNIELLNEKEYHFHIVNNEPRLSNTPKVLIFGDSYFGGEVTFLGNNFKEVTLLHTRNVKRLKYYVEKLKPELVIMEATERVMGPTTDMYNIDLVSTRLSEEE